MTCNFRLAAAIVMAILLAPLAIVPAPATADEPPGKQPPAKQQLDALFADSWEFGLAEDPLFATHAGDGR